jgi:hypothetical protein
VALLLGFAMTLAALIRGKEGPNEGYGGKEIPHLWRFPGVMRRQIESVGFRIERFEAGPLILPYLTQYVPLLRRFQPAIDRFRGWPILRNLGYGSLAICRKAR